MLKRFPIIGRIVLFLLLPLGVVAGVLYFSLADLPEQQLGEVLVDGPSQPIQITRDDNGIPAVKARSDRDAFFATGYLHAQDRLWQLELQRRTVQGRLSEVFGESALSRDIWMRTLGLYLSAQAAWPALSTDTRVALQAYADGVNAWIELHRALPLEFRLLGIQPERWTPIDSLAWSKAFALDLGGNMGEEIQHTLAASVLDPPQFRSLFGETRPAGAPVERRADAIATWMKLLEAPGGDGQSLAESRYVGSNAWVISGRLTRTGAPMLANDPHLGLQIPSLWYAIVQEGDRLRASGMGLVGLPMVVFGQNGRIAWGGTNLMADTQDLYVEQLNSAQPNTYLKDGQWVALSKRKEVIRIRPAFPSILRSPVKPVEIEVRSTDHGPLVSDVVKGLQRPVALRWVALDSGDTSIEALLQVNYAGNWREFNEALKGYAAPALNFVYADRDGNIGYVGAGHIPIRSAGIGGHPVNGWDPANRWTGYIPFDKLPRIFNPESGMIVSANNDLTSKGYAYFISSDWAPEARANRIAQLLDEFARARHPLGPEDMGRIQSDIVSVPAGQLNAVLLGRLKPKDERQRKAAALLAGWHGEMSVDSPEASIFNAWTRHLRKRLFANWLKPGWTHQEWVNFMTGIQEGVSTDRLHEILVNPENPWCREGGVRDLPMCAELIADALDDALEELQRLAGSDMRNWAWGRLHHAVFAHVPFSDVKLLDRVFERRIATGGSVDTVNVADAAFKVGEGYRQSFGAGFRQVIELNGSAFRHLVMNSIGQSGNVLSRRYDDMIEAFRDGGLFPIQSRPSTSTCLVPHDAQPTRPACQ